MLKVSDIMTAEVLTLEPELTLREAVERLEAEGITGAPVVGSGKLVGVVSQADLLDFQATSPGVPRYREGTEGREDWSEAEVMDRDAEDDPASYFAEFWHESEVGLASRFDESDSPEWNVLEEHTVSEVMTRRVVAVSPTDSVREAAELMVRSGVHRVLVLEDSELRGIVTSTDVVRAVAEGRIGG